MAVRDRQPDSRLRFSGDRGFGWNRLANQSADGKRGRLGKNSFSDKRSSSDLQQILPPAERVSFDMIGPWRSGLHATQWWTSISMRIHLETLRARRL
jgi:hypothetical protein